MYVHVKLIMVYISSFSSSVHSGRH